MTHSIVIGKKGNDCWRVYSVVSYAEKILEMEFKFFVGDERVDISMIAKSEEDYVYRVESTKRNIKLLKSSFFLISVDKKEKKRISNLIIAMQNLY